MRHVPWLHILCDLEASLSILVLSGQSEWEPTMSSAALIAEGFLGAAGCEGDLLGAVGAGEVVSGHAAVAGREAEEGGTWLVAMPASSELSPRSPHLEEVDQVPSLSDLMHIC